MTEDCDLVVVGGGPAGVEAALASAETGLRTVLVDEAPAAGGQVYRSRPEGFRGAADTPETREGDRLRARLAASTVITASDHAVWSVSPGFRVDALGPAGARSWRSRAVIAATGAQERVVPFPGWTEPGVIGLAGATILLKSQHVLPGRRTLVAGCGPLLLAVAAGLLKAGGEVAAVVDLASSGDWAARMPALVGRPDLLARGAVWLARVRQAGVPVLSRHGLLRVERVDGVLRALVGPVGADRRPRTGAERAFAVDAVAVGHGLTPSGDVTRLLRAEHLFDAERGGWVARRDQDGRTSLPGLWVAGDGSGIAGAAAAVNYLAGIGQRFGQSWQEDFVSAKYEGRRLDLKTGMSVIKAYEKQLAHRMFDGLKTIKDLQIYGITDPAQFDHRGPTFAFTWPRLTPRQTSEYLGERGIFTWSGNYYALNLMERLGLEGHGGAVRIGLAHYNTFEEIDYLLNLLEGVK